MLRALILALVILTGCRAEPPTASTTPVAPNKDTAEWYRWLAEGTYQIKVDCPDGSGSGSGVVIYRDEDFTYIATAAHVANWDCAAFVEDEPFEVVAVDEDYDQAILVGFAQGRTVDESAEVFLGQDVIVVGYPRQPLTGKTAKQVTEGNVSSFLPKRYKVSAEAYFGNSGGPCFDAHGNLVGLVVALFQGGGVPYPGEIYVTPAWHLYKLLNETL